MSRVMCSLRRWISMRAEIIATGTELLSGGVIDTNSLYLSEELMLIGLETAFKTVVGDDEQDMEEALRKAFGRAAVVIVTGGIGPTEDDITRKVIAKIVKKRLVLNDDALKAIHTMLAGRGKRCYRVERPAGADPDGGEAHSESGRCCPGFLHRRRRPVHRGPSGCAERDAGHVP